jgi:hypothetical protein
MNLMNLTAALVLFSSLSAQAGDCVLKISREACPGKETEAYKPYNGKKETEEKKSAADEAACKKEADKASKIVRKGTLSTKTVTATFDGKPVAGDFKGTSNCK